MEGKHVHHSYVWLGSIGASFWTLFVLFACCGPAIFGILMDSDSPLLSILGSAAVFAAVVILALAVIVLVVVIRLLSWKRLTYQCRPETFDVHSGIFFKKSVHIPYERIQGVDQTMGIVQRILGLCDVKIDTAAGSDNQSARLPFLTKADAEALREELLTRKACALHKEAGYGVAGEGCTNVPGATATTTATPIQVGGNPLDIVDKAMGNFSGVFSADSLRPQVTYEQRLSTKELILAALSNSSAAFGSLIAGIVLGIAGIFSTLGSLAGFLLDYFAPQMEGLAASAAGVATKTAAQQTLGMVLPPLILGCVGMVLAIWLIAAVATAINLGGFTVRRAGDRVEMEHGLLSRKYHGINMARIQSVRIKQGLIRRAMGYCEVSVGKIEGVQDNNGNSTTDVTGTVLLHPFMKRNQVDDFLKALIPDFPTATTVGVKPAPVAKRRAVSRNTFLLNPGFWCLLVFLATYLLLGLIAPADVEEQVLIPIFRGAMIPLMILSGIAMLSGIPDGLLWFKHSQMTFGDHCITVTNGGFAIQTDIIPRNKIQSFSCRENPLQRMAKIQTVRMKTAAGNGQLIRLRDLAIADCDAWYNWMKPHK